MAGSANNFRTVFFRCVLAIGLAVAMLTTVAFLRPKSQAGVPEAKFWLNKFSTGDTFDVVAAGDSRVLRGVTSEPFVESGLGTMTNFGFRGAPLNEEYLNSALGRLKKSGQRILLVGITPNAFTPDADRSSGYTSHAATAATHKFDGPDWWYKIQNQLRPTSLAEISRIVRGKADSLRETYHSDGWVACRSANPDETYALPFYQVRFDKNRVSEELISESLEVFSGCQQDGVILFGFQPPVYREMAEIENLKSGFAYSDYIKRFEKCGGVWLAPDATNVKTYDASHLDTDSAVLFSRRLAKLVNEHLDKQGDLKR